MESFGEVLNNLAINAQARRHTLEIELGELEKRRLIIETRIDSYKNEEDTFVRLIEQFVDTEKVTIN